MKADVAELAKLKAKFETAKAKKNDLERGVTASQNEVAQRISLVEKEKANLANFLGCVKVADLAISDVGNQAMQKTQHIV